MIKFRLLKLVSLLIKLPISKQVDSSFGRFLHFGIAYRHACNEVYHNSIESEHQKIQLRLVYEFIAFESDIILPLAGQFQTDSHPKRYQV